MISQLTAQSLAEAGQILESHFEAGRQAGTWRTWLKVKQFCAREGIHNAGGLLLLRGDESVGLHVRQTGRFTPSGCVAFDGERVWPSGRTYRPRPPIGCCSRRAGCEE